MNFLDANGFLALFSLLNGDYSFLDVKCEIIKQSIDKQYWWSLETKNYYKSLVDFEKGQIKGIY